MAEPKPSVRIQELCNDIAAERGLDLKGVASLDNSDVAFLGILLAATIRYFDEQHTKYVLNEDIT